MDRIFSVITKSGVSCPTVMCDIFFSLREAAAKRFQGESLVWKTSTAPYGEVPFPATRPLEAKKGRRGVLWMWFQLWPRGRRRAHTASLCRPAGLQVLPAVALRGARPRAQVGRLAGRMLSQWLVQDAAVTFVRLGPSSQRSRPPGSSRFWLEGRGSTRHPTLCMSVFCTFRRDRMTPLWTWDRRGPGDESPFQSCPLVGDSSCADVPMGGTKVALGGRC